MEENIFMQKQKQNSKLQNIINLFILQKKKKIEVHSGDNTKGVAEHPLDKKISKSVTHR